MADFSARRREILQMSRPREHGVATESKNSLTVVYPLWRSR